MSWNAKKKTYQKNKSVRKFYVTSMKNIQMKAAVSRQWYCILKCSFSLVNKAISRNTGFLLLFVSTHILKNEWTNKCKDNE